MVSPWTRRFRPGLVISLVLATLVLRRSVAAQSGAVGSQLSADSLLHLMDATALEHRGASGRIRIRAYASAILALGDSVRPQMVRALERLATYGEDSLKFRIDDARRAIGLASLLPESDRRNLIDPIARAYLFLAQQAGNALTPETADTLLVHAIGEMTALGFTRGDTTERFFWARALDETAERYALVGTEAKPLIGGTWLDRGFDIPVRGEVTLIEFGADWCLPCRESYPALTRVQEAYGSRGFRVVLATTNDGPGRKALDPQAAIARASEYYRGQAHVTFPVFVSVPDGAGSTPSMDAYHVQGFPELVLIDRAGIIRQIVVGWDDKIAERLGPEIQSLLAERWLTR
jgi:thiol-disulfide isomerase/thioredoxin